MRIAYFDRRKRFCPEGTVAVAVGIRRPYISLRSGAAPARPCAKRPAFRRWTASGKLPAATAAACRLFFLVFLYWGKEQSFARVFGGRKGDVRRQRAYRRKQKFASLIFDSGKRFCSVGTVAVAVGIRRPYISLRSGAAPARPCAQRPAFRRWTASGKLPVAMPLKRLPF